MSDNCC